MPQESTPFNPQSQESDIPPSQKKGMTKHEMEARLRALVVIEADKQAKKEALEEAAARETLEEIGLEEIRFLEELGKISIWFRDRYEQKGKLIHKDIYYFLFETAPDAVLLPDPSQHTYDAKWVPIKKVLQTSSYSDLAPIIKKALGYLAIR